MTGVSHWTDDQKYFILWCRSQHVWEGDIIKEANKRWARKGVTSNGIKYVTGGFVINPEWAPGRTDVSKTLIKGSTKGRGGSKPQAIPKSTPASRNYSPALSSTPAPYTFNPRHDPRLAQQMRNISGGQIKSSFNSPQPLRVLNTRASASSPELLQHAQQASDVGIANITQGAHIDSAAARQPYTNSIPLQRQHNRTSPVTITKGVKMHNHGQQAPVYPQWTVQSTAQPTAPPPLFPPQMRGMPGVNDGAQFPTQYQQPPANSQQMFVGVHPHAMGHNYGNVGNQMLQSPMTYNGLPQVVSNGGPHPGYGTNIYPPQNQAGQTAMADGQVMQQGGSNHGLRTPARARPPVSTPQAGLSNFVGTPPQQPNYAVQSSPQQMRRDNGMPPVRSGASMSSGQPIWQQQAGTQYSQCYVVGPPSVASQQPPVQNGFFWQQHAVSQIGQQQQMQSQERQQYSPPSVIRGYRYVGEDDQNRYVYADAQEDVYYLNISPAGSAPTSSPMNAQQPLYPQQQLGLGFQPIAAPAPSPALTPQAGNQQLVGQQAERPIDQSSMDGGASREALRAEHRNAPPEQLTPPADLQGSDIASGNYEQLTNNPGVLGFMSPQKKEDFLQRHADAQQDAQASQAAQAANGYPMTPGLLKSPLYPPLAGHGNMERDQQHDIQQALNRGFGAGPPYQQMAPANLPFNNPSTPAPNYAQSPPPSKNPPVPRFPSTQPPPPFTFPRAFTGNAVAERFVESSIDPRLLALSGVPAQFANQVTRSDDGAFLHRDEGNFQHSQMITTHSPIPPGAFLSAQGNADAASPICPQSTTRDVEQVAATKQVWTTKWQEQVRVEAAKRIGPSPTAKNRNPSLAHAPSSIPSEPVATYPVSPGHPSGAAVLRHLREVARSKQPAIQPLAATIPKIGEVARGNLAMPREDASDAFLGWQNAHAGIDDPTALSSSGNTPTQSGPLTYAVPPSAPTRPDSSPQLVRTKKSNKRPANKRSAPSSSSSSSDAASKRARLNSSSNPSRSTEPLNDPGVWAEADTQLQSAERDRQFFGFNNSVDLEQAAVRYDWGAELPGFPAQLQAQNAAEQQQPHSPDPFLGDGFYSEFLHDEIPAHEGATNLAPTSNGDLDAILGIGGGEPATQVSPNTRTIPGPYTLPSLEYYDPLAVTETGPDKEASKELEAFRENGTAETGFWRDFGNVKR